ncbi:thiamine-phosphate kinase [Desulfonatronovibrio hydrogenovorans]|uniref:thiamine-phosphate kinase n=1 Tax=Desulfonatronovibrio hydrogenovorans TaxID=53245 RepID=UPI00054FCA5B|nr:thiamine-phosphate kinase [Desulfonatronovibrio hydrogenovorans]
MIRSEDQFLALIDQAFPNSHPHMVVGRGDDCAVLSCPDRICLTSDLFLENIHFRLDYFQPADIGHKALAVNLSDLAAHGAMPLGFNLNLVWPAYLDEDFCRSMLAGMADLAQEHQLALTGGDLSFGPYLGLGITIWGKSPDNFMLRKRCFPGDLLFVVGEIGLARCGLHILEEQDPDSARFPKSVQSHLRPRPLNREGIILAESGLACGMMDVSDGLAADLPRFLAEGNGVALDMDIRFHSEVLEYCQEYDHDPLIFSLQGGEDYALLAGCREQDWPLVKLKLERAWKLGRIVPGPGLYSDGHRLSIKGFDHFKKD